MIQKASVDSASGLNGVSLLRILFPLSPSLYQLTCVISQEVVKQSSWKAVKKAKCQQQPCRAGGGGGGGGVPPWLSG